MKKHTVLKIAGLALTTLFTGASMASAAIIFNSVSRDLNNISPTTAVAGSARNDNTWSQRNSYGETGTTILEAWNGSEDVPVLTQTISGLTAGQPYDIYVNYIRFSINVKQDGNRGGIRGSLNNLTFTLFNGATGIPGTIGYATTTGFVNADRAGLRGYLGTAVANETGKIFVYVDDDGLNKAIEERVWFDGVSYESLIFIDSDNDGMEDDWERANGLIVGIDDSTVDPDEDGLTNFQEYQKGTDPQNPDTDGDGLLDGVETGTGIYVSPTNTGTDPLVADTDGDGHSDGYEVDNGSDPTNPNSIPPLPGGIVQIAPNGAWTWFNDERAIFHNGILYSGYTRSDGFAGVTRYDPATQMASHMQLGTNASKAGNDHNNPSLTILPDGRLLAVYSRHSQDRLFFHRTSNVIDPTFDSDWSDEQTVSTTAANSYANTYRLSVESDMIYNFHRDINWNPTLTCSADNGVSWNTSFHFINKSGYQRPYPRYVSNHSDRIDLIYTDGHPASIPTSIYHLYYQAGSFKQTDGTEVKTLAELPLNHDSGERGTVVYPYSTNTWGVGEGADDWIPSGRAWTWDIHYDTNGHPICTFQVQLGLTDLLNSRIHYYYARWTGTEWQRRFIAKGGRGLYNGEEHYGGGISIDPEDTRVVYISSNARNPFDLNDIYDHALDSNERYEIWRGFTADGGLTFAWMPVTENSTADNLRPIVPENHHRTRHVIWFNGRYSSYTSFSTKVLGVFDEEKEDFTTWKTDFGINGETTDSDWDGDGLSDLHEYALGGNPTNTLTPPFPTISSSRFSFQHLPTRTDIEWIVETTPDLLDTWIKSATIRAAGLPNEIAACYSLDTDGGNPALLTIAPTQEDNQGFYRLKVRYEN